MPATASGPGSLTEPAGSASAASGFFATLRRALEFSGRSSRSELVSYLLGSLLVSIPVSFVTRLVLAHEQHLAATNLTTLVLALPVPALLVRRYHDSGRSGAWVWLAVAAFAIWAARTMISMLWGIDARLSFDRWTWLLDWVLILTNLTSVMLALFPANPGANRFGPNPRAGVNPPASGQST